MKKTIFIIALLIFIFSFGFYLRTLYLPENMLFGYEQGRDALVIKDILSHKLTLLGPKTDIEGIFHGVGYYYWLAFVYFITQGDPGKAIVIFAAINALTCIIVYFLAKEIIGKKHYALLASFMTAISFDVIIYGRWLSNVSVSIPLVALFFYCLTKLVKTKNPHFWIVVGLVAGLLSHFELLHILYACITILIAIKLFSLPIKNRQFLFGIGMFLLANASFFLFDVRHDFLLTKAVLHYLTSQALSVNPLIALYQYSDGLVMNMVASIFPSNGVFIFLSMILLCLMYIKSKKDNLQSFQLILLILFFSFPYIFLLKYNALQHFYAGTAIGWIILFNFLISRLQKSLPKYAIFLLYAFLIMSSLIYVQRHLADRSNIFYHAVQKHYIYKDQLKTIDYLFSHAEGGFSIETFTLPYFHQEAWQYLYDWYGKKQYPKEYAQNADAQENQKLFLIIEPGTQGKLLDFWITTFNNDTTLVQVVKIGEIVVQERIKKSHLTPEPLVPQK